MVPPVRLLSYKEVGLLAGATHTIRLMAETIRRGERMEKSSTVVD
jgi:hypothetical protein